MQVEQISVFLENKTGRLSEVTSILAKAGVNIRALSLADTSDFGVLRMIVSDHKKAKEILKTSGFAVGSNKVVAVAVNDEPGGLNYVLEMLHAAEINVEYMYAFVRQSKENAVMIFRLDRTKEGIALLLEKGIRVIEGIKLYNM
jgi:hypothetical protein